MHEMALVSQFLDIILDEIEGKGVKRVTSVHLTIGELMDVVDELVPGLFKYLARGTVCEDAEVVIKDVPAYVQCHECHEAWHINVRDQSTWTCPRCGAYKKYRMISGREFRLDSIEVEMETPEDAEEGAAMAEEAAESGWVAEGPAPAPVTAGEGQAAEPAEAAAAEGSAAEPAAEVAEAVEAAAPVAQPATAAPVEAAVAEAAAAETVAEPQA